MKFIGMTLACLIVGGSIGAVLGLMHDQFVWFVNGAYHALSNPFLWK